MRSTVSVGASQVVENTTDNVWVAFPGGELEGRRPRRMCPACRERADHRGTLCFQCYRAELGRERALQAARELDTASEARFQSVLPLEPVDVRRLERLRTDRAASRAAFSSGPGSFADRQRRAQMAARRATQQGGDVALQAAELQLPASWWPFVMSGA